MLKTIFNFFKKPVSNPPAPTPYKVEAPTAEAKIDAKPAAKAKKATGTKPAVKAKTARKPKAKKAE